MRNTIKLRNPLLVLALAFAFWFNAQGVAQAAQKVVTSTLGPKATNWQDSLVVDKFDPTLGTLTAVDITLDGSVNGTAKYESTDPKPTPVVLKLSADIELQRPNNAGLLLASPTILKSENADKFDGVIDYAGASGSTFPDLAASATGNTILTAAADLALFTGPGQIVLPVKATGTSKGTGSGNLIAEFQVNGVANVKLVYTYTPTAPAIALVKRVYAGQNAGAGCAKAKSSLVGKVGDPITYCFVITNTGVTYLSAITLNDTTFNLSLGNPSLKLLSGNPNAPLPPGGQLVYYYETTLTGDLDNHANTEGNPTDQNGTDLPNFANVKDTGAATVRVGVTATVTTCKLDANGNKLPGWTINLGGPNKQSGKTGADGCITFNVNQSGNYSLTEVIQTGWTQITPGNNGNFSFVVNPNSANGPYNFVNGQSATIKTCKVNDVTGTPLPGWQLNLNGPEQKSATTGADGCVTYTVGQSGNYTLTETLQPGWEQVVPANPPYFSVGPVQPGGTYGQNNEYTFRNRPTGQIAVIKAATPSDGTDFAFDGALGNFVLDDATVDDQDGIVNTKVFSDLTPGGYVINELLPNGWLLTNFACVTSDSNDSSMLIDNSATVDLDAGENITCTFTNTGKPGLKVIKVVENGFGGTAKPGDFTIHVIGNAPLPATFPGSSTGVSVTLNAGTYSVTEESLAGYVGEYSSNCVGSISNGENKVCTITNRQQPGGANNNAAQLTLIKSVINDNGGTAGPNDFGISINGQFVNSGQTITVTAGNNYVLNELGKVGYQFVKLTGIGCPTVLGGSVTPATGETIVCTITNDDTHIIPGTVSIGDFVWRDENKDGLQNDGPNSGLPGVPVKLYTSDGTFTGLTRTSDSTGHYLFENLPPGSYFVEFGEPDGYSFTKTSTSNANSNSDADRTTGRTPSITVTTNRNNPDLDAGFVPAPKLVISKRAANVKIQPGSFLTYTIAYTNEGVIDAIGVVISETVPNFTTFVPARSNVGWNCQNNATSAGTNCTFTIGKLAAQVGKGTLTFVVQINKPLLIPDDGIVIFNQLVIGQVKDVGTVTKPCCRISSIVDKPTAAEATDEPDAPNNRVYLPAMMR